MTERGYSEDDEEEEMFEDQPDFSDTEDFVDDITDADLLRDLMSQKPKESDGVDSVVVVDGVPSVEPDRIEKLKMVVRKIYSGFGRLINEHYPLNEKGATKGYIFLEFENHLSAVEAVKMTDRYVLDKSHTFSVNLFSDFEKFESIPADWEEPTPEPYKDQGNLKSWLLEPDSCDQFSVVSEDGGRVSVLCNTVPEPTQLHSRPRWTESYVTWSPLGTFLATIHFKGVALWGGDQFTQVTRFTHTGVQYIDFSPKETYIVTYNPRPQPGSDTHSIIIWETRTRAKKRIFDLTMETESVWPIFKWSFNDKYFARIYDGALSVYETPSFGLLDKKSIKVPGMKDFSWSPSDNVLAYWVAEDKYVPARVTLIELPSRNEVRVKNLFSVANCKMHWQKSGDFLCVKVDRYSKLRKEKGPKYAGIYYNFEIFHIREKQIPVDSLEIKENVAAFAWEPVGNKFAIIHGESSTAMNISFYSVKNAPVLIKKYEKKAANHLFWSPTGQFIVLAGMRSLNGVLEFVDTSDFTSMNCGDHFMCTDVEWDPTGRYLMTGVSYWWHKMDNAYWLWSFQGKLLKRFPTEQFCQLSWRARPLSLLGSEKVKEVKKNLKKYSEVFNVKDRARMTTASKELIEKRQAKYKEYMDYRAKKTKEFNSLKEKRMELRNGIDTDTLESDSSEMEEEVVEFLIKEDEVVVT